VKSEAVMVIVAGMGLKGNELGGILFIPLVRKWPHAKGSLPNLYRSIRRPLSSIHLCLTILPKSATPLTSEGKMFDALLQDELGFEHGLEGLAARTRRD
jgi:hypothetical protein